MSRTLRQMLRIVAPPVIWTLYNGLRQIQALATLTNYVHMHLMNNKFLASLYIRKLACLFVFF
jgi:hypothetical protein